MFAEKTDRGKFVGGQSLLERTSERERERPLRKKMRHLNKVSMCVLLCVFFAQDLSAPSR